MSLLGWPPAAPLERVHEKLERRAHALTVPERPVHWSWLHGPAARPDVAPREARAAVGRTY